MDDVNKVYKEEAYELLAELEESLLELEEKPDNKSLIERVFRAMHTIKGSSSMFGFQHIADFTHEIETVFDLIRDGIIPVTKEIIEKTLQSRDQILEMLEIKSFEAFNSLQNDLLEQFKTFIPTNLNLDDDDDFDENFDEDIETISGNSDQVEHIETVDKDQSSMSHKNEISDSKQPEDIFQKETIDKADKEFSNAQVTYRIRFKPNSDLLTQSINPIPFLNEIRELGDCNVIAQTNKIPSFDEIDPEKCYTYWDIVLTTNQGIDEIKDVFLLIDQQSEIIIQIVDEDEFDDTKDYKKIGEILTKRQDVSKEEIDNALNNQKRIGRILLDNKLVDSSLVESALAEQKHV